MKNKYHLLVLLLLLAQRLHAQLPDSCAFEVRLPYTQFNNFQPRIWLEADSVHFILAHPTAQRFYVHTMDRFGHYHGRREISFFYALFIDNMEGFYHYYQSDSVFIIRRYDARGTQTLDLSVQFPGYEPISAGRIVSETDGSMLLTFQTKAAALGGAQVSAIARVDTAGAVQWVRQGLSTGYFTNIYPAGPGALAESCCSHWLDQLDENGQLLWTASVPNAGYSSFINGLAYRSDGSWLMSRFSTGPTGPSFYPGIFEFDADGAFLGDRFQYSDYTPYGLNGYVNNFGPLTNASNEDILYTFTQGGIPRNFLVRTDANLNIQCVAYPEGRIMQMRSFAEWDRIAAVTYHPDNTVTFGLYPGDWPCSTTSCVITDAREPAPAAPTIDIFPNPGNGSFQLRSSDCSTPLIMRIFDLNGKMVFSTALNTACEQLNLRLAPNVYFVEFTHDNGNRTLQKLMIK